MVIKKSPKVGLKKAPKAEVAKEGAPAHAPLDGHHINHDKHSVLSAEPVPQEKEIVSEISPEKQNFTHEDLDHRQEFFRLMSEKLKEEGEKDEEVDDLAQEAYSLTQANNQVKGKSLKAYRRMAVRFVILAVILLAAVLYFTMVKLTLVLEPKKEAVAGTLDFQVYGSTQPSGSETAVKGTITRMEVEETGVYQATGEKSATAELKGKVTIINNYSKSQPLVATTRLLSPDNKLYRIKEAVTVPAGGQVEVAIYSDTQSEEMAIGPTKFTIPGLWQGIQDKIYAESKEAFTYNAATSKIIDQADVDKAVEDLSKILISKVQEKIKGQSAAYDQAFYATDPATLKYEILDAKVGEEKERFTVRVSSIVNVIAFSFDSIKGVAEKAVLNNLPKNKLMSELDKSSFNYALEAYDLEDNKAEIKASFQAKAVNKDVNFVDKNKLLNLNKAQLDSYLQGLDNLEKYEIKFFPPFIKRAPALVDRIELEVK